MFIKYTAHLKLGDYRVVHKSSNDLRALTVTTLNLLDEFGGIVNGTIQDNYTGCVVHRCSKNN